MTGSVAAAVAAPVAATTRIGLGGLLSPEYNAALSLIGEPPYALDVGASLWPDATPQMVRYPSGMLTLLAYDRAVSAGDENLTAAIYAALEANPDEQVVVAGVSMGSIVIDHVIADLADDPDAPTPEQLTFATYADPQRGLFRLLPDGARLPGYVNAPVPESPYNVIAVHSEYDGFSDPPDRPWNVVASANAVAGAWLLHGTEIYADLDDVPADNITVEQNSLGATTTTYIVPAKQLPITMPLRGVMPNVIVDQIDDLVRPVIDRGYQRHDQPGDERPVLRGGEIVRPGRGDGNDAQDGAESSSGTNPKSPAHDQAPKRHKRNGAA